MNFELGIMRFGLSILLNKSLLVGFLVGCGNVVLAIRTTLQDIFTMNLADVKLAIVLQFADKPRYWGLKGNLHSVFGNRAEHRPLAFGERFAVRPRCC